MPRWSIRKKVTVGFALALAILALVDMVSYRSITSLTSNVRQVNHRHDVLHQLDDVLAQLKNAETGQRGYLLSGEEAYLEPYRSAIRRIDEDLAGLRRVTAGDTTQRHRLNLLRALINQKLAELNHTIELRRTAGFDAAVEVVRTDRGKAIMDRIRTLLDEMENEERRHLRLRDEEAQSQIRFTFYIIGFGSLLGLLLVGVAAYVIDVDVKKRERAEQALQAAHDHLEVRVRQRTMELKSANEELKSEVGERRRAERRLAEMFAEIEKSRDDMQSILNRLQLGTAIIKEDGRVEFLSEAAQRLFGRDREEILGTRWDESFGLSDGDKAELKAAAEHGKAGRHRVPVHLRDPRGRQYWLNIDVQDDPRDAKQKIFFLYDVSEVYDLRRQLDDRGRFQNLVGKSAAIRRVYQLMEEVAKVDSTVLIEGATGTGKELVARAIHLSSGRKEKPFIAVNSAGLAEALAASQLFGHRRGAFTGAVADQQGLFEAAQGGTLFLDEIGDIPLNVQITLLRVLQEKEITRLGESRPRKVDVRVLAATQHDLAREVEKGNFRADLLYRIRVARINLPRLSERREDIPLLVDSFLAQGRAVTGKDIHDVSSEAMRMLLDYDWPGNVRELKSAVEFALIYSEGPVLQAAELPPEISGPSELPPVLADGFEDERERILAALRQARGNRSVAARLLGVSRSTLYRRLSDLEISTS